MPSPGLAVTSRATVCPDGRSFGAAIRTYSPGPPVTSVGNQLLTATNLEAGAGRGADPLHSRRPLGGGLLECKRPLGGGLLEMQKAAVRAAFCGGERGGG